MFRRLTARHWSWLHFKFAVLVWAVLLIFFTPTPIGAALGVISVAVGWVTIVGCLVSVVGLVMSAQTGRTALLGLSVEFIGLLLTLAGPVSYFFTQVYLACTLPNGDQRYALAALAYAFSAAVLCRLLIVGPRRSREAHDPHKGA